MLELLEKMLYGRKVITEMGCSEKSSIFRGLPGGCMGNGKGQGLQDLFLNQLRKEKIPVLLYLTNGVRLKGIIKGFDSFVILLKDVNEQLIYKHAVSTIVPEKSVELKIETTDSN